MNIYGIWYVESGRERREGDLLRLSNFSKSFKSFMFINDF